MQPQKKSRITIIGAGMTGCYLAVLLAKRGFRVDVYEKMSRKEALQTSKRSINISFHNYTSEAFKKAGVWSEIKKGILPLKGSITKLPHYKPILASFSNLHLDYFSARREKLLASLIGKAETYPNLAFHFDTSLISIDRYEKKILFQTKNKKFKEIKTDVVIGADGVNSLVRAFLQQGQHTTHLQNQTGWEYKQITFSPETIKHMILTPDRAYSSTRKNVIFVSLPNKDGTFSGMLALPESQGFDRLKTDKDITTFITNNLPELAPGLPEIIPALKKHPNGSFITMTTAPWFYKDFMVIVGDACHSVTPFIGHGVTVGLGDATALVKEIDRYGEEWEKVFTSYQEHRKKHTDTIVAMSLESFSNFKRERKANYRLIYSKLESLLHRIAPFFVASNTFERIVFDPDRAAEYMETHRKQRRKFRLIGVPLLVSLATAGILSLEMTMQLLSSRKTTKTYANN